ncbi:Mobile element protein [Candidatus Enterovibrio altilux]|uniref:Mobile element protein n=1 Tax=Candidatus Enterovibrio altilux TaxID=1927128 RepID=A0A291B7R9_9GAMM|nr:Mobile element protein [Candidatus Enterovibrio luxaltus]
MAVDLNAHDIITAELNAFNMTNGEVLPNFCKQTHRKIHEISNDSAYDTK